jgi:hypothetical protein
VLLIAIGCSAPAAAPVTNTPAPMWTASSSVTLAPTSTGTFTPSPRSTKTSTPTVTVTATGTPEPPTPTPGPTLSNPDLEAFVLDLLDNNAGCELPCWWGFKPGVTAWETARDFFLAHGAQIWSFREGIYLSGFRLETCRFGISTAFYLEDGVVRVIETHSETVVLLEPAKIIYGNAFLLKAMKKYTLSEMLPTYGKPREVLLFINSYNNVTSIPDYSLLVFYPERGILVNYEGRSERQGDKLRICPWKTQIGMKLWSPDGEFSLADAYAFDPVDTQEQMLHIFAQYHPWEEVIGTSIDDFFKTFQVEDACFDTPAALWGRK